MASDLPRDDTPSSPARRLFAVVPHDANPITPLPKAIRFNTAGTVTMRAVDEAQDVTLDVFAGERFDARIQYIRDTGTTDGIVIHALA